VPKEKSPGKTGVINNAHTEQERMTEHQADKDIHQLVDAQMYKVIFESANDIMIVLDKKGKIIDVNGRSIEISGYAKEEIVGKSVKVLSRILTRKSLGIVIRNLMKRMAGVNVPPYEIEIIKKTGEILIFEVSAQPLIKDDKIIGDLGILRDVTNRKLVENETQQKSADIHLINLINEAANQAKSFEDIFQLVSDETQKLLGGNVAIIYLMSTDKQYLIMRNLGMPPRLSHAIEKLIGSKISGVKIRLNPGGIYTQILNTGKAVLTNDPSVMIKMASECTEDKTVLKFVSPIIKALGVKSAISVPLKSDHATIGLMDIARREPFTESDMRRIETIAGQLTTVIKRKQAEEANLISEQNFRNSLDNSSLGIHISDGSNRSSYANQALLDIFGYENIDEVKASPLQAHYTPKSYASWVERNEKLLRGEPMPSHVEIDIIRKDGTIHNLDATLQEVFWNGKQQFQSLYNDITERKQAEEGLKSSEEKYSTLIEESTDGIIILKNRIVEFANHRMCEMSGYSGTEILGMPFLQLAAPEYKDMLDEINQRVNARELVFENYEMEIIAKDGRKIPVDTKMHNIDYKGSLAAMVIIRDITESKQAEQLYHTLVDSAPVGVYIQQDYRFIFTNQDMQQKLGYTEKELLNMASTDIIHPEDRPGALKNMTLMLQGKRLEPYEYRIFTKNGDIKWTLEKVASITYQGRQAVMGITIDSTESKQARQIYQTLADSSPVGVYIRQNEKFVFTNPAFQNITGYSPEELLSIDPLILVHPEDRENVIRSIIQLLKGEHLEPFEFRLVTKSGKISWGLERMTTIIYNGKRAMIGNFMDITERRISEEKLGLAAQEWRITFDSITDLISIHDKDNKITRVNKAVADVLKTTPKELIGKYCHEVMHGTKEPPANCPHLQTLKTGKPAATEIFNPKLNIYFHESTSPLFNNKGEITGSIIVARDITQQKRIEEQLIMTDRLASIGELSSGIAHELNNPLTSVIGFSQLLMEGEIPEHMREDLSTIYNEAQRAASIVKNLLTFARKHAPVKQLSQINVIIEDVLRLRAYEEKVNNIEIINHLANNLPLIMIDHFQMQQVFLNIVVNAEFAMLEAHHKGKLTITSELKDDIVRITFADDGPGIPEQNLKSIFDPFFTTKEVGKGTGLGLSICHGIVNEHGGTIYAKSEKGQGAAFIIELPLNR
jgi:PAS domain S-box-containing protein